MTKFVYETEKTRILRLGTTNWLPNAAPLWFMPDVTGGVHIALTDSDNPGSQSWYFTKDELTTFIAALATIKENIE